MSTDHVRCHHEVRDGGVPMTDVLRRAGVPTAQAFALECRDVHEMALLIARSNQWVKGERTLIAEIPDRPLPTPSWLSVHRAGVTVAGVVMAFFLCLYAVLRIAS